MASLTGKKLFLVDAMAHIYRAFYAPMNRMNAPSGLPTKVPFLFNNILRRILKDYEPDYVGHRDEQERRKAVAEWLRQREHEVDEHPSPSVVPEPHTGKEKA